MVAVLHEAGWPEELHEDALAVAWCESRWRVNAVGDRGAAVGAWQVHVYDTAWAPLVAAAGGDIWDPVQQAAVALRIYEIRGRFGGWGGWTCASRVGAW